MTVGVDAGWRWPGFRSNTDAQAALVDALATAVVITIKLIDWRNRHTPAG